jgi:DNA-binding MarR family transcriptional regulator
MTVCQDSLSQVAHVPPSVQTVYCALYGHQPMTGRQLRDATNLPRRTIYAALQRLRELDVIKERASLRDTRMTFYWVAGVPPADAPPAAPAAPTASAAPAAVPRIST